MQEQNESPESQLPQQLLPEGQGEDQAANSDNASHQRTACFNCRSARQRCNRQIPCKPDTVEKLLSRINESNVRDQVIASILESAASNSQGPHSCIDLSAPLNGSSSVSHTPSAYIGSNTKLATRDENRHNDFDRAAPRLEAQDPIISPLHIMGAAFAAGAADANTSHQGYDSVPPPLSFRQTAYRDVPAPMVERLISYFGPQITQQKDWQALAGQSIDHTFKLGTTVCDPVTARLIDHKDAVFYFKLFFKIRNPFVGLLDPVLHTPDYVYSMSFTLFSVICALGCAVSSRPRDRIMYPALLTLAEGSMKWSIAASVKSLETIQAIINMQYWAPICQKQSDDPCWLYLNHATQLAREIGIHRPAVVTEHLKALPLSVTADLRERVSRNFERTWLYTFIADKSFGIINGRPPTVSRKEIPASAISWWQKSMASPHDRMISGIVEIRLLLLNSLDQRQRLNKTLSSISNWHSQALAALEQVRDSRCIPNDDPSSIYLPILAFYMDHSILVLNAQAMMELAAIDGGATSAELLTVSQKTTDVASHMMGLVLSERIMCDLMLGFHNNQFIMICHAATEIIHAIKRSPFPSTSLPQLISKMRSIPERLGGISEELPASSAVHLYVGLSRFFACQFDRVVERSAQSSERYESDGDVLFADWYRAIDDGSLDPAAFLDTGVLGWEQPIFGNNDFTNEAIDGFH